MSKITPTTAKPFVAKSDAISLRELSIADAPFVRELTNQSAWLKFIGDRQIHSIKDAQSYIKKGPQKSYKRFGFGLYIVESCRQNTVPVPVGLCGLLKRQYLDAPDLGFAISEHYYKQGYAYEASKLVLKMALEHPNINYIYASTTLDNVASQFLLLKLGFVQQLNTINVDNDELFLFCKNLA